MSFINLGSDELTTEFLKKSSGCSLNAQCTSSPYYTRKNYKLNPINTTSEEPESKFEKRQITLKGDSRTLDKIEQMLAYMMWLGRVGHSTTFKVGVDGDGGFGVTILRDSKELTKVHKDSLDSLSASNRDISSFDFD